MIKDSLSVRSLQSPLDMFKKGTAKSASWPNEKYRPLTRFSYALDYRVWRLDPRGYHLTSIFLHALTTICLYLLVRGLFVSTPLAFWAAVFFMAHPVHVEAVAYISGRNEILALLFMILAMIFYLKEWGRLRALSFLVPTFFFVCALLSKENSFVFPLFLCLYHVVFKKKITNTAFGIFWGLCFLLVALRLTVLKSALLVVPASSDIVARLPGFFVSFLGYVRLLIAPFDLHMGYSHDLFFWNDGVVIAGIVLFLSLCAVAVINLRKRPFFSFAIGWFIIALLPVAHLYPLPYLMTELWLYTPSLGFCLLLAGGMGLNTRSANKLRYILAVIILSSFSFLTIRQNTYWQDPVSFYEKTLRYRPQSPVLYMGLGNCYEEKGDIAGALWAYKKAIEVDPRYAKAYISLGEVNQRSGALDEAVSYYQKAMKLAPGSGDAYINLAAIYAETAQPDTAIALLKKVIILEPRNAIAYYDLGNVYFDLKRFDEAQSHFKKAVELQPAYGNAYSNMAITYFYLGEHSLAQKFSEKASALGVSNQGLSRALQDTPESL